jgi:hypothetical protein
MSRLGDSTMKETASLSPKVLEYKEEMNTFLRELPRLLADGHQGKHVLVSGNQVLSIWDSFDDACQAASERFEIGQRFLIQPIDKSFLDYPWPDEYLTKEAV